MRQDPNGHGILQFDNGVTAYVLDTGRGLLVDAVCAHLSDHGDRQRQPRQPKYKASDSRMRTPF